MSYDSTSSDAMFSRVIQRLDTQDGVLTEILAEVKKTNGRVRSLEDWRLATKIKIAVVSAGVSASVAFVMWIVSIVFGR